MILTSTSIFELFETWPLSISVTPNLYALHHFCPAINLSLSEPPMSIVKISALECSPASEDGVVRTSVKILLPVHQTPFIDEKMEILCDENEKN